MLHVGITLNSEQTWPRYSRRAKIYLFLSLEAANLTDPTLWVLSWRGLVVPPKVFSCAPHSSAPHSLVLGYLEVGYDMVILLLYIWRLLLLAMEGFHTAPTILTGNAGGCSTFFLIPLQDLMGFKLMLETRPS